jgi:hypothetical protein
VIHSLFPLSEPAYNATTVAPWLPTASKYLADNLLSRKPGWLDDGLLALFVFFYFYFYFYFIFIFILFYFIFILFFTMRSCCSGSPWIWHVHQQEHAVHGVVWRCKWLRLQPWGHRALLELPSRHPAGPQAPPSLCR